MATFLRSPLASRLLFWAGALTLAVGATVFLVVMFNNGGSEETAEPVPAAANAPQPLEQGQPTQYQTVPKGTKLAPDVRTVAGKFILTAVARKNLAEAYNLTHPDMRLGMTLRQWKTGNIPVQPYDVSSLSQARFDVQAVGPKLVSILVGLLPKKGSKVKPGVFDMDLSRVGQGAKRHWVVSYWMPKNDVGVRANPVTGS